MSARTNAWNANDPTQEDVWVAMPEKFCWVEMPITADTEVQWVGMPRGHRQSHVKKNKMYFHTL